MATLFSPITFYSCKENIDESAYAIAEKKQIVELLERHCTAFGLYQNSVRRQVGHLRQCLKAYQRIVVARQLHRVRTYQRGVQNLLA